MSKRILFAALLALTITGGAEAGTNEWTIGTIVVPTAMAGRTAEISPTVLGPTQTLDCMACNEAVIWTYDTAVTFDVEWCMFDIAGAGSGCRAVNFTTPLDASTIYGLQIDPMARYLRVNVVSGTTAIFQLVCRK